LHSLGLPISIAAGTLFLLILFALLVSSGWEIAAGLFAFILLSSGYAYYVGRKKRKGETTGEERNPREPDHDLS